MPLSTRSTQRSLDDPPPVVPKRKKNTKKQLNPVPPVPEAAVSNNCAFRMNSFTDFLFILKENAGDVVHPVGEATVHEVAGEVQVSSMLITGFVCPRSGLALRSCNHFHVSVLSIENWCET